CNLDRTVVGFAVDGREHRIVAICVRRAAPSPELRLDNGETLTRVRMNAAENGAADTGKVTARETLAQMWRQAAPQHVVQAHAALVVDPHGRRLLGVKHGARGRKHAQWTEGTAVRHAIWIGNVLDDHLQSAEAIVATAVVRARLLWGVVPQ